MALQHHAGVPVGRARPRNHHLGLDLDTPGHPLSLPQSNFPSGQFGLSQTDDYLARRKQRSTRSIMKTVQMMTVIVVSSDSSDTKINRRMYDRRMNELSDKGGCQTTGGIPNRWMP
jgi:hypothetical protein